MQDILVLGGYGNFGKRISRALAQKHWPVTIAGRNLSSAEIFAGALHTDYSAASVQAARLDAEGEIDGFLSHRQPRVLINTCGPFQNRDYRIAEACIRHGVHYIDLADGRDFVVGIARLNEAARMAGISVTAGASTVPALSAAVLEHYRKDFSVIDSMAYGISPGQKTERGLATTRAILSYVGKRLKPAPGDVRPRYGWQDLHSHGYPEIGRRWFANCDIPDIDLFPAAYGIRHIRFGAGLESPTLHGGLWLLSWLVRWGVPLNLSGWAPLLLRASRMFDAFGSADGGMHIVLHGKDRVGASLCRRWFIVAREGDGPQIPCVPAIILADRIMRDAPPPPGASPCIGLIAIEDCIAELAGLKVKIWAG